MNKIKENLGIVSLLSLVLSVTVGIIFLYSYSPNWKIFFILGAVSLTLGVLALTHNSGINKTFGIIVTGLIISFILLQSVVYFFLPGTTGGLM